MSMTRTECSMEIDEFYHCHRCVQPSCWLIRGYLISCSFIIYKTKLAYSPLFVSISLNLKYEFEELGKFIGYFGVFVCVFVWLQCSLYMDHVNNVLRYCVSCIMVQNGCLDDYIQTLFNFMKIVSILNNQFVNSGFCEFRFLSLTIHFWRLMADTKLDFGSILNILRYCCWHFIILMSLLLVCICRFMFFFCSH